MSTIAAGTTTATFAESLSEDLAELCGRSMTPTARYRSEPRSIALDACQREHRRLVDGLVGAALLLVGAARLLGRTVRLSPLP